MKKISLISIFDNLVKDGMEDPAEINECLDYCIEELGYKRNDKVYGLVQEYLGNIAIRCHALNPDGQADCCQEFYDMEIHYCDSLNKTIRYFIIEDEEELDIIEKHQAVLIRDTLASMQEVFENV